jgi:hypothetical protein
MAISDSQKIDYLWKKLGYGATKTDTNARKKAPNEAIVSPLLLRGDKIWAQAGQIPTVIPTSTGSYVQVYLGSNAVETTEDGTATNNRTWKTELTDWIPPEFGSTYQVKVYVDDPSASDPTSTGTQIFATGSGNNDDWFFDYQSGVLHFISTNLPSSVSDSKSIYISGARYIGEYGQPGSFEIITANVINAVTADFANSVTTNTVVANVITAQTMTVNAITANVITANSLLLDVPLPANSGGTGLDSFTTNGILFASDAETLSFVTGTSGKILQINSTGEPVFDDLNGGTY